MSTERPANPFRYFNSSPEMIRLPVGYGPGLVSGPHLGPWSGVEVEVT